MKLRSKAAVVLILLFVSVLALNAAFLAQNSGEIRQMLGGHALFYAEERSATRRILNHG